jgi:hypothetical protein
MNPIFKKLNYKNQSEVFVLNSPKAFNSDLKVISEFTHVRTSLLGVKNIEFILIFVKKKVEIDSAILKISTLLNDDAILWFAYPKGTLKKYKCDFNRDTGWEKLGEFSYEGVRMVAIDEDWSALRFRKAQNIKSMNRRKAMAMSNEGKNKTKGE